MEARIFIVLLVSTHFKWINSFTTSISGEISADLTFIHKRFPVLPSKRAIMHVDLYDPVGSFRLYGRYAFTSLIITLISKSNAQIFGMDNLQTETYIFVSEGKIERMFESLSVWKGVGTICRAIMTKGMVFRYTWVYSKEDTIAHTRRLVVTS